MTKPRLQEEDDEKVSFEASILLVCGLPGSGKSTLINDLVGYYSSLNPNNYDHDDNCDGDENDHYFDEIVVIDYDKITASIASTIQITSEEQEEDMNTSTLNHSDHFTKEELEAWRRTRKEALKQLENELHKGLQFITLTNEQKQLHQKQTLLSSSSVTSNKRKVLIIMDDNFHLRSMRRNIYQKCQQFIMTNVLDNKYCNDDDYSIGLVIIHLDLPLEQCINQNEQRIGTKQYIPTRIIQNMSTMFENPNSSINFESNIISLYDTKCLDTSSATSTSTSFYPNLNKAIHKSLSLQSKIKPCQNNFDKLNDPQYQYEREMTMKSKLHNIDLLLRSLVSAICKEFVSLAKVANGCRKLMLNDVKCKIRVEQSKLKSESNSDDDDDGHDGLLFLDESNIVIEFGRKIISDSNCPINKEEQEKTKIILQKAYDVFFHSQTSLSGPDITNDNTTTCNINS